MKNMTVQFVLVNLNFNQRTENVALFDSAYWIQYQLFNMANIDNSTFM